MALFWLGFRLMLKLYWLFCGIKFTFLQNYYILQLLTIGHGYPVPVDKHDSDKKFTPPLDPLGGVKCKIFKFYNNSVSCQQFLLNCRMQTEVK